MEKFNLKVMVPENLGKELLPDEDPRKEVASID
jgi:hypothetical protein